jgi:hypothetical protein
MLFDTLHVVIWLAIALGLWNVSHAIYDLLLSPLRGIPGPFFARFSSLWELDSIRRNGLNETYIQLHEKYGQEAPFLGFCNPG